MPLSINFQFSQNSLQDYLDCPRRFELRFLLRQAWPALQSEPVLEHERHMEMGSRLHEMIHQFHSGLPVDEIETYANDPQLAAWWSAFINESKLPEDTIARKTEVLLSFPIEGFRVVAKYDLLIFTSDGCAQIYDWKTSLKRTSGKFLAERMQTRLYQFLLCKAARHPQEHALLPSQIKMTYWFANFPNDPEIFQYSESKYRQDENFFSSLIREIISTSQGKFLLTQNEKSCAYCNYRSLCNRGVRAGDWREIPEESETSSDFVLDFSQVAEIEF